MDTTSSFKSLYRHDRHSVYAHANPNISIKTVTCKLKPCVKQRIDSFITGFIRELTLPQCVPNDITLSILSWLMDLQHIVIKLDNILANYSDKTRLFEIKIDSFLPRFYDNIKYKLERKSKPNGNTVNWTSDNIYDQKCIAFIKCDFPKTLYCRFQYQLSIMHKESVLTVSDWTPYNANIPPPVPLPPILTHKVKQFFYKIGTNEKDKINLKQWLNGLIACNICTDKYVTDYKCLFYYIQYHKQNKTAPFIIIESDVVGLLSRGIDINNNKYKNMQSTLRQFIFAASPPTPPPIPNVIECLETVRCTLKPCVKVRILILVIGFIRELMFTQIVPNAIALCISSWIMDLQHITVELNHIKSRLFEIRISSNSFLPRLYNDIKYKLEYYSHENGSMVSWSADNIYGQGCVTFMQCSFKNFKSKYSEFQYQISILCEQTMLTVSDWTNYDGNIPPGVPPVPQMEGTDKVKYFIAKIGGNNDSVNLEQWLNGLISCNVCNDDDLMDYKCLFYYLQYCKRNKKSSFIITIDDLKEFMTQVIETGCRHKNKYCKMQNKLREIIVSIKTLIV